MTTLALSTGIGFAADFPSSMEVPLRGAGSPEAPWPELEGRTVGAGPGRAPAPTAAAAARVKTADDDDTITLDEVMAAPESAVAPSPSRPSPLKVPLLDAAEAEPAGAASASTISRGGREGGIATTPTFTSKQKQRTQ